MNQWVAPVAMFAALASFPVLAQEFRASPFFLFELEGNFTADITLADVDGDGDLDVLTANGRHWAQPDFVYLNNGTGRLLEGRTIGSDRGASYTIQAIDLDGDSDLDAVVVRDELPLQLFENDGEGHFTFSGIVEGSGGAARSAIVFDGNGDGHDDLLVFRRRGSNLFFAGDGKGGFATGRRIGTEGAGATGGAASDLDMDGDIDVVVARRDGNASLILENDGLGNFKSHMISDCVGDHRKAVVADFDGDGHPEIALGGSEGVHVFSGQGTLNFSRCHLVETQGSSVQALATSDVDSDGAPDLVVGVEGTNLLLLNQGGMVFETRSLPGGEADTYGIAIGDMDGDGLQDIAVANSGAENVILRHVREI